MKIQKLPKPASYTPAKLGICIHINRLVVIMNRFNGT